MTDILKTIYNHKLLEVEKDKNNYPLSNLVRDVANISISRNFFSKLKSKADANEVALICEIKKASPSKPIIRRNFDPIDLAKTYELAGGCALSVLTDERFFQGCVNDLILARKSCDLPILRKEFMVDPYQVYQAKAMGADCILIILAMIDDVTANKIEECAIELGLSVLIEVHNEEEMARALKMKSRLIGVNNRDLKTFITSIDTSIRLSKIVSSDHVLVSESGIKSVEDIKKLRDAKISCFLIGEHFLAQDNVADEVKKFLNS